MQKLVNGRLVDLTAEEISARQAEEKAQRDFEKNEAPKLKALAELKQSDIQDVPRIAEDIWALLVSKGIATEDELPAAAVKKLEARKALREKIKGK